MMAPEEAAGIKIIIINSHHYYSANFTYRPAVDPVMFHSSASCKDGVNVPLRNHQCVVL